MVAAPSDVLLVLQGLEEGEEESPFAEDVEALQGLVVRLAARRDALLAEVVQLRQKGPLPPLRPGPGQAGAVPTAPGPSAYHGGCVGEQVPPPPRPWPPACVSALKSVHLTSAGGSKFMTPTNARVAVL